MPFSSIEKAIEEVGAGRMVIVVDDKDRENEGDLVMDGIQGSSVLTRS